MAETSSALADAPFPGEVISRAEEFARESFVLPGEDAAQALAPGTARRAALEDAVKEIESGREQPSIDWRRSYSLMLGLERLLSEEEPHLADGDDAQRAPGGRAVRHADRAHLRAADRRAARNGRAPVDRAARAARSRSRATSSPTRSRSTGTRPRRPRRRRPATPRSRTPARPALLVRARHRRRQDRRGDGLRRRVAHRRHPDPHPPAQPGRPVHGRAARARLPGPGRGAAAQERRRRAAGGRPRDGRDLPVVRAQRRARSRTPTRSSSATRRTPRWARRPAPRSASGSGRCSSA